MLCEISFYFGNNFFYTWFILSLITFIVLMIISSLIFYCYYVKITYSKWLKKTNPKYPSVENVRNEILLMLKGILSGTFCPSMTIYLMSKNQLKGYCGIDEYGWSYLLISFFVSWFLVDFFEFFYHRIGHTTNLFWNIHKSHHQFYNPSPFSVIAEDYIDQIIGSSPLLLIPIFVPINIDLLFFQFAIFFYGYGVYLHWGHELSYPDAHHSILNTSFQHYLHHAISTKNRPYHTGFFFKIWDQLFESIYPIEKCFCVKCQYKQGKRTLEHFQNIEKPDYSLLLNYKYWFQ
ncbi:unnamed protein product [Adineta steineri]|uniref:Fatty acid hydroxylase domain-containing protein n=1 Tax=Adineta steineri TaxID=433720 RepID=A0A813VT97_9BILA|nr:unnamed protein product [Adineta steineri]CAF1360563.1 unnamed protein product [Adineta steineri]